MESTQPILRCRYSYDPLDRLISQLQPDAPAHQRFYCKSRLATEIQGTIGFSVFQNNDLLLAQRKSQGSAVESTLLATDLQRSVLHTFTADQQKHPIAYSPYGHRQAESGLTSRLGFNGERPDPVTGHYLLGNGYRAFNPVLMRFNSPDSLSPFGSGGLNSYAYCWGDPINLSDPLGHTPFVQLFKKAISSHVLNAIYKKTKNTTSNIPGHQHPKMRLKTQLKAEEIERQNTMTLLKESSKLEQEGKKSGNINPLTLQTSKTEASHRYLLHQEAGIPFDDSGIPSPSAPITTTNNAGQEVLRTDFFDDSISYFHHQSNSPEPQKHKDIMSQRAGETIIKRAEYIRQHARRN
ncbi:MAG: RHS repeat-associated core domain-containing protein [Pseudomonas fluorescens]|nr:RHS repeat-associated core domain-containing protein [Pseudomonas fluorescens]